MLGNIGQDQIGRDRGHLIESGLPEFPLDVVFLGEAEAAVGLHAGIGGVPGGISGQHLGHVGLGAAIDPGFVFAGGFPHHQFGGPHRRIGLGDRELDALILADRPAEHHALAGIVGGLLDEPLGVADALRGDQDALGVHAGQDITKALALFADQVFRRDLQIVEEHLGGGVVHHGADRPDGQAVVLRRLHVDDEHREAVGALGRLVLRRGARQQDHQVGVFGAAGPDLLAVDDVVVALAFREGLERRGIGAAGRLGDAERLQPQFTAGNARQPFRLLRIVAVPQQRAHGVHLRMAATAVAAGTLDLLQDCRRRRQLQPGAAVFLGDQDRQIAGLGQRIDEFSGIGHFAVELAPVLTGELFAQLADGFADVLEFVSFGMGHRWLRSRKGGLDGAFGRGA